MSNDTPLAPRMQAGIAELLGEQAAGEDLVRNLCAYLALLNRWNRAYNLVSPRSLQQAVSRHILDSLSLSPHLGETTGEVLDFGCGAGLPGIPLALGHPERRFTLLDRSHKKTRFVRQAVLELGLDNVTVHTADAKQFEGGPFAVITARAVGTVAQILEDVGRLLAPGGSVLLLRGATASTELAQVPPQWQAKMQPQGEPLVANGGNIVALRRAG